MPNNMERWFAGRQEEKAIAAEMPEARVERLQKLGDVELTECLQQWLNIRTNQEQREGVRDDVVQLDLLFGRINSRLDQLGQPRLRNQEDLP